MKVWVIRGGRNGEHESMSLDNNLSVIGWHQVENLTNKNEEQIKEATKKEFEKPHAHSQIARFVHEIQQGDIVALPLKTQPGKVAIGRVTGNYEYREIDGKERHTRKVDWVKTDVQRIDIGKDMLNSLAGQLTIFQVRRNNVVERFEEIMKTGIDPELARDEKNITPEKREGTDPETTQQEARYIITEADQQILHKIDTRFDGHQFEEFIGEILTAEGYAVEVTQRAKDGGVDILAIEKTMLGLENLVCVQTKMTNSRIGPDILRALQGSMQNFSADYGLLVSWNGFTSATEQEAKQNNPKIKLWGAPQIMEHFYKHYHKLPEEIQRKVPLQHIWTLKPDIDAFE